MEDNCNVKILLIDDEEDVRDIFERTMKEYGYINIKTSDSVEHAKEFLSQNHFDFLIVDMRFHSESKGFELVALGDDENSLASSIIVFTANDDVMDCRKAFKMGAWDYIPKNLYSMNPYEELHKSIQESIKHTDKWGNEKDNHWVNQNIDEIIKKYDGKYIAVMDNKVIADANDKDELDKIIKDSNLPTIMPLRIKVQK